MRAPFRLSRVSYRGYNQITIDARHVGVEHIVPPAGEAYAFDLDVYEHTVVIAVSPTGRSVRVWVDGKEVK